MRRVRVVLLASVLLLQLAAAEFRVPAGTRPPSRRPGAQSVLPGGRMIEPHGRQALTGPGSFGLAASPDGRWIVSADSGPSRPSLTAVEREGRRLRGRRISAAAEDGWSSVSTGLAFHRDRDTLFVSEGDSGRVRELKLPRGRSARIYNLNQGGFRDSHTGDLAFDERRDLLYVVDRANSRLVIADTRRRRILSSVSVGRMPLAIALSPDGLRAWVTNAGMLQYDARSDHTGFPAFGFPSPGAARTFGDPNAPESNSVCAIDVEDPEHPRVEGFIRTGQPFGGSIHGGSSPSGLAGAKDRIFVSNAHNDTVTVIDAANLKAIREIPLRIPGLEHLRGVLPAGLAFHEASGWLLVAEAGINAVGIIDTNTSQLIGHIPAGWFPTRVVVGGDNVYVANAKGYGTGATAGMYGPLPRSFVAEQRRGSISLYPLPGASDLPELTARMMELNGFRANEPEAAALPPIRHVVLIVKENRTYDELLGDIAVASNGPVNGSAALARFGRYGSAVVDRKSLQPRLSRRGIDITPNHHELAAGWAFSDNFYADSEAAGDGHHWLSGTYPNVWVESSLAADPGAVACVRPESQLEAGTLWHHLERNEVSFRNFGFGFADAGVPPPATLLRNTSADYPPQAIAVSDHLRAMRFVEEVERRYRSGTEPFPRLVYIHLPNDRMAAPRPDDGYPFDASYIADNDGALGRIVEYLSHSPWWREMAIFVTEDNAQGGVDHVDSHRTILLVISPYAKKNYVSRVNTSFPGLLKTIFGLLGIPPLNLFDATAASLADVFTATPDFTPYEAQPPDGELFKP